MLENDNRNVEEQGEERQEGGERDGVVSGDPYIQVIINCIDNMLSTRNIR